MWDKTQHFARYAYNHCHNFFAEPLRSEQCNSIMTLVLILTIAGLNSLTVITDLDAATCARWGSIAVENGDATEYRCLIRGA